MNSHDKIQKETYRPNPLELKIKTNFIFIVAFVGAYLHLCLQSKRSVYFVYLSLLVDLAFVSYFLTNKKWKESVKAINNYGVVFEIAFCVWCIYFKHKIYIYYFPLMISIINKIYRVALKEEDEEEKSFMVMEMVKIESSSYLFLFLYLSSVCLERFWGYSRCQNYYMCLKFVFLLVIVRLRYHFCYWTRVSFFEIHLKIDGLSSVLRMRRIYHCILKTISQLFFSKKYYQYNGCAEII